MRFSDPAPPKKRRRTRTQRIGAGSTDTARFPRSITTPAAANCARRPQISSRGLRSSSATRSGCTPASPPSAKGARNLGARNLQRALDGNGPATPARRDDSDVRVHLLAELDESLDLTGIHMRVVDDHGPGGFRLRQGRATKPECRRPARRIPRLARVDVVCASCYVSAPCVCSIALRRRSSGRARPPSRMAEKQLTRRRSGVHRRADPAWSGERTAVGRHRIGVSVACPIPVTNGDDFKTPPRASGAGGSVTTIVAGTAGRLSRWPACDRAPAIRPCSSTDAPRRDPAATRLAASLKLTSMTGTLRAVQRVRGLCRGDLRCAAASCARARGDRRAPRCSTAIATSCPGHANRYLRELCRRSRRRHLQPAETANLPRGRPLAPISRSPIRTACDQLNGRCARSAAPTCPTPWSSGLASFTSQRRRSQLPVQQLRRRQACRRRLTANPSASGDGASHSAAGIEGLQDELRSPVGPAPHDAHDQVRERDQPRHCRRNADARSRTGATRVRWGRPTGISKSSVCGALRARPVRRQTASWRRRQELQAVGRPVFHREGRRDIAIGLYLNADRPTTRWSCAWTRRPQIQGAAIAPSRPALPMGLGVRRSATGPTTTSDARHDDAVAAGPAFIASSARCSERSATEAASPRGVRCRGSGALIDRAEVPPAPVGHPIWCVDNYATH